MKKSLILAAAVSVALTSCMNETENLGQQEQSENLISFASPFVGLNSRGGEGLGYMPGEIAGQTYSTKEKFNIFSFYSADKKSYTDYIINETVSYFESINAWAPSTNYAWPLNGSLTFLAYSPAGAFPEKSKVQASNRGLFISDFTVPKEVSKQFDLMYTEPSTYDCKSSSKEPVQLKFKHALSSVDVKLNIIGENYANGNVTNVTLDGISFNNIKDNADFVTNVDRNSVSQDWTNYASSTEDYSYNLNNDMTVVSDAVNMKVGTTITFKNKMLLLPQTADASRNFNPAKDPCIAINLLYKATNGKNIKQTAYVDLTNVNSKNGFMKSKMQWEKGIRYIYNVTLHLDNIVATATVEEWKMDSNSETNKDFSE